MSALALRRRSRDSGLPHQTVWSDLSARAFWPPCPAAGASWALVQTGIGRARIASPSRNRRMSDAAVASDCQRFSGAFCRHTKVIVSTSRGRPWTSRDGGAGSAFLT